MTFDKEAFLTWLDEQDGYYINPDLVREEWPSFYEHYELVGVTSTYNPDTGDIRTPIRDYRQTVLYGQALD